MNPPTIQYNLEEIAAALCPSSANVMVCAVGDSTITDSSSASNVPFGWQRSMQFNAPIVARMGRVVGPFATAHAVSVAQGGGNYTTTSPQSTAANIGQQCPTAAQGAGGTAVAAGSIYAANQSPSPNPVQCYVYNNNQSWSAGNDVTYTLNGLSGYKEGDWTAGVPVMGRLMFYANANALPNARTVAGRSSQVSNVATDHTTSPGTNRYQDADCGSGAGTPYLATRVDQTVSPDYNETNKNQTLTSVLFFKHDGAGNPLKGIGIMDMAIGGHTTESLLAQLGGGASPAAVYARIKEWLANHKLGKRFYFPISIGINLTSAESTELSAGTKTTFKNNLKALVAHLRLIEPDCLISLNAPHMTPGYTVLHCTTKWQAMLEVAQEVNCGFFNRYAMLGRFVSNGNAVTGGASGTDYTHPSANGAEVIGALDTTAIQMAYEMPNALPRVRR